MKTSLILLCLVLATTTRAQIQIVDTSPGTNQVARTSTYTQNFDSLTGTVGGRPWTDNVTLPGWYVTSTTYGLGFGVGEGIFSMGNTGGQGDRALGAVASAGIPDISGISDIMAVKFKNLTSSTLTSVFITYDGEQWNRTAAANQRPSSLLFAYQVFDAGAGAIYFYGNTGWTFVPSLDFTSPNATLSAGSTLDGNAPENSVRGITSFISGFSLAPGQELWLSWGSYVRPLGTPIHGLGIDNLSVSFATSVPEPASYAAVVGAGALLATLLRRRRTRGAVA
jgi:hypothetical protein